MIGIFIFNQATYLNVIVGYYDVCSGSVYCLSYRNDEVGGQIITRCNAWLESSIFHGSQI